MMRRPKLDDWQIVKREKIVEDKFLDLYKYQTINPNGNRGYFWVVKRSSDFAVVIPKLESGETLLVGQFRPAVERVVWEFPMGSVQGKPSLEMAKTELREETGYLAKRWLKLGQIYPASGLLNQQAHIFLAQDLSFVGDDPEPDEFLSIKKVSFAKLNKMIDEGEIVDGISIAAYYLFKTKHHD